MTDDPSRDNLRGGAWLIADMSLNIWALSIVKALGAGYPSVQIVFLRALVGLVLLSPLIWRQRARFRGVANLKLHLLRIVLSVVTLISSFYAVSHVPLALFTTMNFTRPLMTMVLAALVLREVIGSKRWIAAGIAMAGIFVALNPASVEWSWGLGALAVTILSGSGAVITMRRLRDCPEIVLMAYYAAGLAIFTLPLAAVSWTPVAPEHLPLLLLVGVFAQSAQFCFLRAHYHGEAGFLSVLGYVSLVLSVGVGYFVFAEVPTPSFALGAALVVGSAVWITLDARRGRRRRGTPMRTAGPRL